MEETNLVLHLYQFLNMTWAVTSLVATIDIGDMAQQISFTDGRENTWGFPPSIRGFEQMSSDSYSEKNTVKEDTEVKEISPAKSFKKKGEALWMIDAAMILFEE